MKNLTDNLQGTKMTCEQARETLKKIDRGEEVEKHKALLAALHYKTCPICRNNLPEE